MNFDFTEEQTMLRDTLRAFLRDRYSFEQRSRMVHSPSGRDPAVWGAFAGELGILGASLPEDVGGMGGGAIENMIIMEEFGKALSVEPWLQAIVISGVLLRDGGPAAQGILRESAAGAAVVIPALDGAKGGIGAREPDLQATSDHGKYRLNGGRAFVRGADRATHFLLPAQLDDSRGKILLLVPPTAAGLTVKSYRIVDDIGACDIELTDVEVAPDQVIGTPFETEARLAAAFDAGVAALCAESLGVQRNLLEATVEYAKQRRQFGKPISEFQVLQHRMADMFIKVEESASMTYLAALRLDAHPLERAAEVSAAKVAVDHCARFVGQAAVQIHGGMGITRELPVADYFARLTMISQELGSTDFHARRYESYSFAA